MIDGVIREGLKAIQNGLKRAEEEAVRLTRGFEIGDSESAVDAIVGLSAAKRSVSAGAKVVKVGDEMIGSLLDIIG